MDLTKLKDIIDNSENILIYGAHAVAEDMYKFLALHDLENKARGFVVSDMNGNPNTLQGLAVGVVEDYARLLPDATVFIATPEKFFADIRRTLDEVGANNIIAIGNKGLSAIQNADAVSFLNNNYPEFHAQQDDKEHLCIKLHVGDEVRKLIPLGAYPFDDESIAALDDLYKDTKEKRRISIPAECNKEFASSETAGQICNLKVYVVSSPKDIALQPAEATKLWEEPLIAGAALLDECEETLKYGDDRLKNISEKNRSYAELTGTYWVWKNSHADYKGISHYRRRYIMSREDEMEICSGRYDAIVTTPRFVLPTVGRWFTKVSSLKEDAQENLIRAVCEYDAKLRTPFLDFMRGNLLYPNNMLIGSRTFYDRYCCFLFDILDIIENGEKYAGIRSLPRYAAYCGELLTSFYFEQRKKDGARYKYVEYELLV